MVNFGRHSLSYRVIPPSVRMKEEGTALLGGEAVAGAAPEAPMRGFVRSLARYILQVSIGEEARQFLGRGHYRRGQRLRVGRRNGYEPKGVPTESGLLELAVPQPRATEERFQYQPPQGRQAFSISEVVHRNFRLRGPAWRRDRVKSEAGLARTAACRSL